MKRLLMTILLFTAICTVNSQTVIDNYQQSLNELTQMLNGSQPVNFKKAVFTVENAYFDNKLDYAGFCNVIDKYVSVARELMRENTLIYNEDDYITTLTNAAIFRVMTDTIRFVLSDSIQFLLFPFKYNFNDYAGEHDWSNMFVTTLLITHLGNCHSMPLLYKILAEEMGVKAWLALAPNHLYIKLNNKHNGWYNTELTSGQFPTDAWLMASGYIHLDAVRNGIYMDTLSEKQSIALCLTDLAQGYQRKSNNDTSRFIIQCCDTALRYYSNYINALLLKVDCETKCYLASNQSDKTLLYSIEEQYATIYNLGYRKMPQKTYLEWLSSLSREKEKYRNKDIQ